MRALGINKRRRTKRADALFSSAMKKLLIVSLGVCSPVALAQENAPGLTNGASDDAGVQEIEFNAGFMRGGDVDVSRYSEGNPAPAGTFSVTLSLNGERRGQRNILFVPVSGNVSAQACFTRDELMALGVIIPADKEKSIAFSNGLQCATVDKWVAGSSANYTVGDLQLDLMVPQAFLTKRPRGYTDPNSWNEGVTAALLDYNSNFYTQRNQGKNYDNANLGLTAGFNFQGWRLRKRINTSWSNESSRHTENLYGYIQRDITTLKSQLTLGDSATSGDLFDSLSLRGVQLQSDDRMLPEGLRNYIPVLRGTADTNAQVRVTQRGQTVYETVVPPGPFEISDVGAIGYGGDLEMTITESDGRVRTQIIPFSAPPMLLHAGVSRFGFAAGELRDEMIKKRPKLVQGFYQYGIGNMYTLYGGGQWGEDYYALALGNAFNTPLGGLSMDITRATADLKDGKKSTGNSFNVGFSKYLAPTDTDVTLAAYRYSSKGYYSFRDAAMERYGARNNYISTDYRTKQRLTLTMGQNLGDIGRLTFTGSLYDYWDERATTKQYMLTFNRSERYFSWALSASRSSSSDGRSSNDFMVSFNVPLGTVGSAQRPAFSSMYTNMSFDNNGNMALQSNAVGGRGDFNELTYSVGGSVARSKSVSGESTSSDGFDYRRNKTSDLYESVNGSVNYNTGFGQLGSTASVSNRAKQMSLSANGSVVAHRGGVTLGPRLGDNTPLALVNAEGAAGAKLLNGYGSRIDGNGYAIMPSLTPYRENTVSVDTRGLPNTVDLLENEEVVIPRVGAVIPVKVKTIVGAPVVLVIRDEQGNYLPIGTELFDSNNVSLGIIGQAGMAFIRGWNAAQDTLYVKAGSVQCRIYPDNAVAQRINNASGNMTKVEVACRR